MNAIGLVIDLFVSGMGAVSDTLAGLGYKILLAMLALGTAFVLWLLL